MIPSSYAMSLPQVYSSDYYFRLAAHELADLELQHSVSVQDTAALADVYRIGLAGRRAGLTEWEGLYQGSALSLGWDWAELEDGDIRAITLVAPRTNIQLIDIKGYDMTDESATACLWAFIATLPWQQSVAQSLSE
jgi:hypothetical protein